MKQMVSLALAFTLVVWASPGRTATGSSSAISQAESAADEPDAKPENSYALEEAVELALLRNPDLLAVRKEMGLARARMATAGQSAFNPELAVEYDGDDLTDNEGLREWQVGILQPLELRGQRGWRKQVAKSGEARAVQRLRQAEWELRSEVTSVFYRLLFLNRSSELAQRRLEVARRLVEVAEARLAGQQIPELEVNLVKLEFHQAVNARRRLARTQRLTEARLAWLMGLESGEALAVTGDLAGGERPESDTSALVRRAIESRGDLAAMRAEVEGAASRIGLEKSEIWPGIALGIFYRQEQTPAETGSLPNATRDRLLGIEASIPLPLLNRRGGEIQEAKAEWAIARARLDALDKTIRREVVEAVETLRQITETLAVYENELNRLSEQNLNDIQRAFEAGEVGAIEVLRAQDDFVGVSQGYYDALLEYHKAAAELAATVGPPLSDSEARAEREEK